MHQDLTAHAEPRRVSRLVIAPRAGDEVMGCGGLLAKHHDDAGVAVVIDPDQYRLAQLRTARHVLGAPAVTFLGLPDGQLVEHLEWIVTALAALIARWQPDELYLPYPSLHQDRVVAYEAGMRSTRPAVPGVAWPPVSVLVYDADGTEATDGSTDVEWSVGEALLEEDIDRKVAAAAAYRCPSARRLKRRAEVVGAVRSLPWAEQFALIRSAPGMRHRSDRAPAVVSGASGVRG